MRLKFPLFECFYLVGYSITVFPFRYVLGFLTFIPNIWANTLLPFRILLLFSIPLVQSMQVLPVFGYLFRLCQLCYFIFQNKYYSCSWGNLVSTNSHCAWSSMLRLLVGNQNEIESEWAEIEMSWSGNEKWESK